MSLVISYKVEANDPHHRLDVFLSQKDKNLSRSQIQRLIAEGKVEVKGKRVKAGMRLKENDLVTIIIPPPQKMEVLPEDLPLKILYEDAHLLVIDKPAGMVVHPGAGNFSGTLVNALLHYCPDLGGIGGVLRPGIVHRLDKGTSGVLVVAKDEITHRGLAEQFKVHTVERKYIGVVYGQISPEGKIKTLIGRHPTDRKKMSTRAKKGKEARTSWRLIKHYRHFSLVEFQLETGRTHQIRVHLASLGHPILGDPLYGGKKWLSSLEPYILREELLKLKRQALHAFHLGIIHPVTKEKLVLTSPLPADLQEAIANLEKHDQPS